MRELIPEILKDRLGLNCGRCNAINKGGKGYHMKNWIVVEVYG